MVQTGLARPGYEGPQRRAEEFKFSPGPFERGSFETFKGSGVFGKELGHPRRVGTRQVGGHPDCAGDRC